MMFKGIDALILKMMKSIILILITTTFAYADDVPRSSEGMRHSAISSGHQNMPVVLYGVSQDWDRSCRRGDEDDCMRIALAFEQGEGDLKTEIRIALGYYLKACETGAGQGCAKAATIIRGGSAGYVNDELAQQQVHRGCNELHDQNSCALVAVGMLDGITLHQNDDALSLIGQSCSQGSSYGCQVKATALYYDEGDDRSIGEAIDMFEDACSREWAWGCAELSKAYKLGKGKPKNTRKALDFGKKGCLESEGDTVAACSVYGEALIVTGDADDLDLGETFISDACTAGDARSCNIAGEIGLSNSEGSNIAGWEVPLFFRESCDMDYADGCQNLGNLYELGYDRIQADGTAELLIKQKACRLGNIDACTRVKEFDSIADFLLKRQPEINISWTAERQMDAITKAAKSGNHYEAREAIAKLLYESVADAQWLLAGWMYYGYPGIIDTPNKKDGITLFENAARQGHAEAAKWIGMAYWYGDGVPQNQRLGQNYMAIAAIKEDEEAIMIYRSMLREPERQAAARRQQEMLAEQERRKNDWAYQFSLAAARWNASSSYSSSGLNPSQKAAADSWRRGQQAMNNLHFNNRVRYLTGATSACPVSNPYC